MWGGGNSGTVEIDNNGVLKVALPPVTSLSIISPTNISSRGMALKLVIWYCTSVLYKGYINLGAIYYHSIDTDIEIDFDNGILK